MSKALKAVVFMGSTREGRMCSRVTKFITNKLRDAKYDVEIFDPVELGLPLLKQPLQFYPDPSQAPQQIRDLNEKIKAADAFIIIAAEYNRQMPPALTNLLDHFPPISYAFKASAIVCYSLGAGGFTSATQARTLMVEFGAPPIPYVLHIGQVAASLEESGEVKNEYLEKQAKKLLTQLDFYANAFRNQRDKGVPAWEGAAVSV